MVSFITKIFITILVTISFLGFDHAFAAGFSFNLNPAFPAQGQTVFVTLSSFDIDLKRAEVAWFLDGRSQRSGIGETNFSFRLEKDVVLSARVSDSTGTYSNFINISTATVDMLWEVMGSYEPPFYKGKIMPISGSSVRVVAIPQKPNERGLVSAPGTFVYSWQKDGSNMAGQSGFGRNSFTYQVQDLDRENLISVESGGLSGQSRASTLVGVRRPEIYFYEMSNVFGPLYNRVLQNNQIFRNTRVGVVAEPYFMFTNKWDNPGLIVEWTLNGQSINVPDKNFAFFESPTDENVFNIGFSIDNRNALLQSVSNSLRLNIRAND